MIRAAIPVFRKRQHPRLASSYASLALICNARDELAESARLIELAVTAAADAGAAWVVTPELATTGYTFADTIGTDWIWPTGTRSLSGSNDRFFHTAGPAVTVPLEPRSSV